MDVNLTLAAAAILIAVLTMAAAFIAVVAGITWLFHDHCRKLRQLTKDDHGH